jgi:hypothetical protein
VRLALHEHTLGQLRLIAKGMGLRCEQYLKRHEVEEMIRRRYAETPPLDQRGGATQRKEQVRA